MVRITAVEARQRFDELIRDVAQGQETVLIEKDGEPQAIVISLDEYTRMREKTRLSEGKEWKRRIDSLRERVDQELQGGRIPPAEDVIRRMREERDEQILGGLR